MAPDAPMCSRTSATTRDDSGTRASWVAAIANLGATADDVRAPRTDTGANPIGAFVRTNKEDGPMTRTMQPDRHDRLEDGPSHAHPEADIIKDLDVLPGEEELDVRGGCGSGSNSHGGCNHSVSH